MCVVSDVMHFHTYGRCLYTFHPSSLEGTATVSVIVIVIVAFVVFVISTLPSAAVVVLFLFVLFLYFRMTFITQVLVFLVLFKDKIIAFKNFEIRFSQYILPMMESVRCI